MNVLELNDSGKQPLTQSDWLCHSVWWVFICLIGWLLVSCTLGYVLRDAGVLLEGLLFGTAAVFHGLIWYKALLSTWNTADTPPSALWLDLLSACWTFGLVLFQLACIGVWFAMLILALGHDSWVSCG